ncbi:MAG: ORF6N domain-containing protein [Proteobacteria bacterium]|nr:ORF6N domain-containing protein [Pseudomonadota bacterium]MBU1714406.1 ORF6N domain-containing protein [Pseudomonadota bacterium]
MKQKNELVELLNVESHIFTLRGVQMMLDRDLAELYGVENRALKQAVKRNKARFPEDFIFELTNEEIESLVSQSVIPSKKHLGGARPFAFTEQGVASLSAVLTSTRAIEINIAIMRAFVKMRQFLTHNATLFQRLDQVEKRQLASELKTNEKFEQIFNALEDKNIKPKQGIFFDGQVFDAYTFVADLIRSAGKSIVLIDNFIDDTVLTLFSKRRKGVSLTIVTKNISKRLKLDIQKFNEQYPPLTVNEFGNSHDRFLIIDDSLIYHFGASLKDLGKKWFAFSKMDLGAVEMLGKLEKLPKVKIDG